MIINQIQIIYVAAVVLGLIAVYIILFKKFE